MVGATGPRIGSRRLDADRRAQGAASRRRTWADRGQSELRCGRPGRCAGPQWDSARFAGAGRDAIRLRSPDGPRTRSRIPQGRRRDRCARARRVAHEGATNHRAASAHGAGAGWDTSPQADGACQRASRTPAGDAPRPNLLGAILVKTRAVDIDDVPENQRLDLALLLSFVDDADALAAELR